MQFYMLPNNEKRKQINRIMQQSASTFNHSVTAQHYIDLYEKILQCPLINVKSTGTQGINKNFGEKAANI